MLLFLLFLLPLRLYSLFVNPGSAPPVQTAPLFPLLLLVPNGSAYQDLAPIFSGINLTFQFTDLSDPYLSLGFLPGIELSSSGSVFEPGFLETKRFGSDGLAILTSNQEIYTVTLSQNASFELLTVDFMVIDSGYACEDLVVFDEAAIILQCQNQTDLSDSFIAVNLTSDAKIIDNSSFASSIPDSFPAENTEKVKAYRECQKRIRIKGNLLIRFCPAKPGNEAGISGFMEIFRYQSNGTINKVLGNLTFGMQVLIADLAIYEADAENITVFLLDLVMGPCTLQIYGNGTAELQFDFPRMIGDRMFKINYNENEDAVLVVGSHYISWVDFDEKTGEKFLFKRINFGEDLTSIRHIAFTSEYIICRIEDTSGATFLMIFNTSSTSTDLLYKLPITASQQFTPSSLQYRTIFLYDLNTSSYQFLSLSKPLFQASCCQTAVPIENLPYSKEVQFTVFSLDLSSPLTSSLTITLNLTGSGEDNRGFVYNVLNPLKNQIEKEFFFERKTRPQLKFAALETIDNDYLSIGVQENLEDINLSVPKDENNLVSSWSLIKGTIKKLPLLKVSSMNVSTQTLGSNLKQYQDPLVLGFIDTGFLSSELFMNGSVESNVSTEQTVMIRSRAKLLNEEIFIELKPNFSSLAVTFDQSFLDNFKNNVTIFDLKTQGSSFNLNGFFNGNVEEYELEVDYTDSNDNESTTSEEKPYVLETLISKSMERPYEDSTTQSEGGQEEEPSPRKILFADDYSILLNGSSVLSLFTTSLLSSFTKLDQLDLANISHIFNVCDDFAHSDSDKALILICQTRNDWKSPRIFLFVDYDDSGFKRMEILYTPIPGFIANISKVFYIENIIFVVETIDDFLQETLIHIFSMNDTPNQIEVPSSKFSRNSVRSLLNTANTEDNQTSISLIKFTNYQIINAKTFNVDALTIEDIQIKKLGLLGDSVAIGVFMLESYILSYSEFIIEPSASSPSDFLGPARQLSNLDMNPLLGNYSHPMNLSTGFEWLEVTDMGDFRLLIYDQFNLREIVVGRFYFSVSDEDSHTYQSFYGCFHTGKTRLSQLFLVDFCRVSKEGNQNDTEGLLSVYVRKEQKDYSIMAQSLSFGINEIENFGVQGASLLIYLQNGTFVEFFLSQGVALVQKKSTSGVELNGTFKARNRYSEAIVAITIRPWNPEAASVDIAFYFLIIMPLIASFLGLFVILALIFWSRRKRKETLMKKFFKKADESKLEA